MRIFFVNVVDKAIVGTWDGLREQCEITSAGRDEAANI